jgi:hypothetical protein
LVANLLVLAPTGVKQLDEILGSERNVKVLHEMNWKNVDTRHKWDTLVKNVKLCLEKEITAAFDKKKVPSPALARSFFSLVRIADSKGPTLQAIISGSNGLFSHILTVFTEFHAECVGWLVDYTALLNHLLSTTEYSQQMKGSQFRNLFETFSISLLAEDEDVSICSTMAHSMQQLLMNYSRDMYDDLDGIVLFFHQWFANENESQVRIVRVE